MYVCMYGGRYAGTSYLRRSVFIKGSEGPELPSQSLFLVVQGPPGKEHIVVCVVCSFGGWLSQRWVFTLWVYRADCCGSKQHTLTLSAGKVTRNQSLCWQWESVSPSFTTLSDGWGRRQAYGARTEHIRSTYGARTENIGKNLIFCKIRRENNLMKKRFSFIESELQQAWFFQMCSVRAPYVLRTCSVCAPYVLRMPAEALHHPTQFPTTTFKNGDSKPQASALARTPFTNRCAVSST